jgi:chemotaxis response regulator CheB
MADAGSQLSGRHPGGPRRRDRIVIGGSAGSLDTLRAIARHFPAEFLGSIFIVAHIGQSRSTLPDLLKKLAASLSRTCKNTSRSEGAIYTWRPPIVIC